METIYDYIVFTDDSNDSVHGNHIVRRMFSVDSSMFSGKIILSFRQQKIHFGDMLYFTRRIKFSSEDLEAVKEFAMLDNL